MWGESPGGVVRYCYNLNRATHDGLCAAGVTGPHVLIRVSPLPVIDHGGPAAIINHNHPLATGASRQSSCARATRAERARVQIDLGLFRRAPAYLTLRSREFFFCFMGGKWMGKRTLLAIWNLVGSLCRGLAAPLDHWDRRCMMPGQELGAVSHQPSRRRTWCRVDQLRGHAARTEKRKF